ncbi:MAG: hypothetical protein QXN95_00270 [Candidatus Bathyarchaeia archaeon]
MAMFRDAFTWVDTGAIAYPALHKKIIELTMPALVVKRLFPEFPLVAGKTATFAKEVGSRSAAITEIAEGSEIPMDFTPLGTVTVTPYKKGLRERVTREMIEDLYIPVIEQQLRRLARRMAYTIDKDCLTVIDQAAANSITATGTSLSATGTEFTISGGLGTKDILKAKATIEGYSFIPDTILLNPINARDVYYLPQFSLYAYYGEEVIQTGAIGTIYGMNVYVSPVVDAGKAYILSTGQNVSAAYAPLGFFVIKRPLTTDVEIKKDVDAVDVTLTTRYAPVVTCGEAIVKVTGLSTS